MGSTYFLPSFLTYLLTYFLPAGSSVESSVDTNSGMPAIGWMVAPTGLGLELRDSCRIIFPRLFGPTW